jgi:hypothetical protein
LAHGDEDGAADDDFEEPAAGRGVSGDRHHPLPPPSGQGLTLVHFSAQVERFVCDRGCADGLCSPCEGGVRGCLGCWGFLWVRHGSS